MFFFPQNCTAIRGWKRQVCLPVCKEIAKLCAGSILRWTCFCCPVLMGPLLMRPQRAEIRSFNSSSLLLVFCFSCVLCMKELKAFVITVGVREAQPLKVSLQPPWLRCLTLKEESTFKGLLLWLRYCSLQVHWGTTPQNCQHSQHFPYLESTRLGKAVVVHDHWIYSN